MIVDLFTQTFGFYGGKSTTDDNGKIIVKCECDGKYGYNEMGSVVILCIEYGIKESFNECVQFVKRFRNINNNSKFLNLKSFVNDFKNKNNNNKSNDIIKMNNINPNFDPVFSCSKSERLQSLKDTDTPVGMDSIINQTIEKNSNDNNNPSSNIDALSKPPNKAGCKYPVYSPHLRRQDDFDIKLKNVSNESMTDIEIDLTDIDLRDIGTDVESLTSPTEISKLTQASVSTVQSLLLAKNESKSISFEPHKGASSTHKFRYVTAHSRNKLRRFAFCNR